jgi:hypothetical protein
MTVIPVKGLRKSVIGQERSGEMTHEISLKEERKMTCGTW